MSDNQSQTKRLVPLGIASSKGFTLVEIIIVMALFMTVIIISSQAFNKILSIATQQTKSSESDIQGVIGLEMLRVDLEHAGYGLPWLLSFPAEFEEASVSALAPGVDSEDFNDTNNTTEDTNKVPRAIQARTSTVDGRDYLAIKSVLAGMNDTVKKWAFVQGVGAASTLKPWGSNDFVANEKVVTIDSFTKRLVGTNPPANNASYVSTAADDFSYSVTADNMTPPSAFQPQKDTDVFVTYGVSPSTTLRVPYNRVDYFIKRPASDSDMPTRCAKGTGGKPGTGILYKAVMNQDGGGFTQYPLLECVADMQVVFNFLTEDTVTGKKGNRYVRVESGDNEIISLSAKQIREQLKEVIVYIVAHEGGRDTGFNYSKQKINVGEIVEDGVTNTYGRELDLNTDVVGSDDYKYYRWKIYKLSVMPRNIAY